MASSVDGDGVDTEESTDESQDFLYNTNANTLKGDCLFSYKSNLNVTDKIINRQIYGRFTKNSVSKTERIFNDIHCKCRYKLDHIIPQADMFHCRYHIYMGFSLCGQFFISYTTKLSDDHMSGPLNLFPTIEYELYIWKFNLGQELKFLSKHRIFKLFNGCEELGEIKFMQFPTDPNKIICYGSDLSTKLGNPTMAFLTVLTLPVPKSCRNCKGPAYPRDNLLRGWCLKHGFILHYMFSMANPTPDFNPHISLAYPDYFVINTGHHVHILNVSTFEPPQSTVTFPQLIKDEENKMASHAGSCSFNDGSSEVSESPSENFSTNSVVDAILEDFSEYDLEGNECNRPFHELNISCEPLNVTGKNYHNTLPQNFIDPRVKRLQGTSKDYLFYIPQTSGLQKSVEKSKIDKKIAEKAYEFVEENEKCEKLSSFRKKRLADKKYEFSEDNSENIVPFNSLRRDRRFFYRSQTRCIRSPEITSTLFLSPRSPSMRSPMQSPNSRNGQFSPGGARTLYCPALRNSPHHSKSPISPREMTRKFNVYSPGLDSDCSDSDSKLILRHNNVSTSHFSEQKSHFQAGLLIVDLKRDETPKWIKKVVRRYSSADFENSSLVSGQSRDDYNIPIEIPLLVQMLTDQHLDIVPEFRADHISETQLMVTQRTFDCEQFVQHRAQKLCTDLHLDFLHCEDYDVKLIYVCPINGCVVCKAVIIIGALEASEPCGKPHLYLATCFFTWNISTDSFEAIELPGDNKMQLYSPDAQTPQIDIPWPVRKRVLVMDHTYNEPKKCLRDYNDYFEVCMDNEDYCNLWTDDEYSSTHYDSSDFNF